MKLVSVEVSLVGVQTDMVVSAVPEVVEGAQRASYTIVATQVLVEVATLPPVSTTLSVAGARALVVHEVSCRQSVADILCQARMLKRRSDERVLSIC